MKKKDLDIRLNDAFAEICKHNKYSNKQTIDGNTGGTNIRKNNKFIHSLSLSQTVTHGVSNNQFEVTLSGNCTILEIENIWKDLYYLTKGESEFTEWNKKYTPPTYSVYFDKKQIQEKFPQNVKETGWLTFEISDNGIEEFKEVIKYIIEQDLIPKLENVRSLQILDNQLNSSIELDNFEQYNINDNGVLLRRIIIARLTNNPLYEEICKHERSFFPDYIEASKEIGYEYFKNIPIVFEEVYNRLKSNKNY